MRLFTVIKPEPNLYFKQFKALTADNSEEEYSS
jgi:hypothetical protein